MYIHKNNAVAKVAARRLPGEAHLELDDASPFGDPDPTPDAPLRVSAFRNRRPLGIFRVEGLDGNALLLAGPIEGFADVELRPGDDVANVLTAGDLDDLGDLGDRVDELGDRVDEIERTPGPPGPPGTPGSVWRVGLGAPDDALGIDGDYYIDHTSGRAYHRVDGAYSEFAMLRGDEGAPGSKIRNGSGPPSDALGLDGDYYVDTLTGDVYARESGAYVLVANFQGPKGPKGDKGDPGDLSNYVTLTTAQVITAEKTFGRTRLYASDTSDRISASGRELLLEQTGDNFGATRLRLQNRGGSNGAVFENAGVDLVDFRFQVSAGARQIRFEARSGSSQMTGSPEFQFSAGPTATINFVVGDARVISTRVFETRSGRVVARTAVSATPHAATTDHHLMAVTSPAEPRTVNLPTGAATGQIFVVVDEAGDAGTHPITIDAPAGGAINGASSATINTDYGAITAYHAGANKYVIIGRAA